MRLLANSSCAPVSPRFGCFPSLVALLLSTGCDVSAPPTVEVEFTSKPAVERGDIVYLKGIRIGETGEVHLGSGGKVLLPVRLDRSGRDVLTRSTVFVVGSDPRRPDRRCLHAHVVDAEAGKVEPATVLRGANSLPELVLLYGAEAAGRIWRALSALPDTSAM